MERAGTMLRSRFVIAALLLVLLGGAQARAHEVFRFVGVITKVNLKGTSPSFDMRSKEEWEGKIGEYNRHLVLREECRVMYRSEDVKRSVLKVGQYVVVDAAGVDITDLEATEIDIKIFAPAPAPPPAKKKK
jgi:hypothetical protein